MTVLYHKRNDCRLCGSSALEIVVPLAPMPIATPNFSVPGADRNAPVFREAVPLDLHLCRECGHLQVAYVGNPEVQYRNYLYTTSVSLGLAEHFVSLADQVLAQTGVPAGALVVELGSNDGTLLRAFQARGMRVLGVDPASGIAERATANGVETIPNFFTEKLGREIRSRYSPAGLIVANNMIANVDDLDDLVFGVRELLADDGVFVFETQYGADVIERNLLDTVYHEHLSYFNVKPLKIYFDRVGLELIDVRRIWTKGGSIRVTVQRANGPRSAAPAVAAMIAEEIERGHYRDEPYRNLTARIATVREALGQIVADARSHGRRVAGYGISVGTTALLPQFDLCDKIDFLFDDDPTKGDVLSGPGYDIPIHSPDRLAELNPAAVIVFAWRYVEPIMARHEAYRKLGGKFVVPLPDVRIL